MNTYLLNQRANRHPLEKALRFLLTGIAVAACSLPLDTAATTLFRNDMDRPVIGTWSLNGEGSITTGSGVNTGGGNEPRTHFLNTGNWLRVAGGTATNVPTATGELSSPGALDGTVKVSFDTHAFTSGTSGRLYEVAGYDGATKLFSIEMDMQHNLYINGVQAVEPNDAFWGLNWTYLELTLNASDFDLAVVAYSPENGTPGAPDVNGPIVTVVDGPTFPTGTSDLYAAQPYLAAGAQLTKIVMSGNSRGHNTAPLEFFDNFRVRIDGDSDVDGLVDWWEIEEYTNIAAYTGTDDPDFDGLDMTAEMNGGTNPLDPDTDADGLVDGSAEQLAGTSPRAPDADLDGVVDGAEVLLYGSDPLHEDVDLDGSPDIVEVTVGTDPSDLFDDPLDSFNLLMGSMAVGQDWTEGLFYNFGSAGVDDVWVIGGSGPGFGQLIRSPEGVGTTFPGPKLILSGEGSILRLKQDDGETAIVDDLRLRGGQVDNGNTGQTLVLDGVITVEASTVSNVADVVTTATSTTVTFSAEAESVLEIFDGSRGLIIDADLEGDQGLIVRQSSGGAAGLVQIRSHNNAFTGGWTIEDTPWFEARGLNSLGSGDINVQGGTLDADYNLALMDSTLTLGDPANGFGGGALIVDRDHYVGALLAGATEMAPGTYTAAQLVAAAGPAYSNSFVDVGGTVTVTGIGGGDADGNGIPDTWEIAEFGSTGQDPNSDADDTDGLTIAEEFATGTDPQVADSDGDTLTDGDEVFIHGTDPVEEDSDGDTLRDDGELVGVGLRPPTNPLSADTDGDSLSDAVESHTGTFVDASDTGTDPTDVDTDDDLFSDDLEVAEGSDPTDADSVPGSILLVDDFSFEENSPVNQGAYDFASTLWTNIGLGEVRWFNGLSTDGGWCMFIVSGAGQVAQTLQLSAVAPLTSYRFRFDINHTSSSGSTDWKAVIRAGGVELGSTTGTTVPGMGWVEVLVEATTSGNPPQLGQPLTIEIQRTGGNRGLLVDYVRVEAADSADSDGDNLPDQWEIDQFGNISTYDGTDDPDMEGLDNLGEFNRGTDPLDPDTDDDGLEDDVETGTGVFVSAADTGTDPLVPDTDGDGLEDGVETDTGTFVDAGDTGTDPNEVDSDLDTFGDGTEVEAGSDPNLISSVPQLCSGAFLMRYEATADVPSVENAAEGWVEVDNATPGEGVVWTNGNLLIDTFDPTVVAGGAWIESPAGGAWGTAVAGRDVSWTYEARVRVLADSGEQGGLAMWCGHDDDPGIAFLSITTNALYWTAAHGVTLTSGVDNATDFHVYRMTYNADDSTYSVYRDSEVVATGLGASLSVGGTRLILGDTGSTGTHKSEVDYCRWDVGVPWTPSPPTADCDGDGLLNNEEDVNGNGSADPGETDQGLADTDGDYIDDGDELLVAGTDPTDANSVFKVIDADVAPTGQLTWSSVPGKTYRVQFTPTMNPPAWVDLADIPADATGDSTSVTDPTPAGTEGHYRVLVLANP